MTAQIAAREAAMPLPRHEPKRGNFPILAPVGIRNRMRLILNEMNFSKTGKLQFIDSSEQKAKASPHSGWRLQRPLQPQA